MTNRAKSMGPGDVYVYPSYYKNSTPLGAPYSYVEKFNYASMAGVDIPHYRRRMNSGALLPYTEFYQFEGFGTCLGVYDVVTTSGDHYYYDKNAPWLDDWKVTDIDLLAKLGPHLDEAGWYVQAAAARIYSSGWDALTFAGELRETSRMFRKTSERLFKQVNKDNFVNSRTTIGDLYLEKRYGWRPLLYDLKDLKEVYLNWNRKRRRFTERAGITHTEVETSTIEEDWAQSKTEHSLTSTYTIGVRGSVTADIEPPKIALNPLTTAWELTKFSFVIDWFYDVGQALEAASFLALASRYVAAEGFQIHCDRQLRTTSVEPKNGSTVTVSQTGSMEATLTRRNPTTVSYRPRYNPRELGLEKSLDLLALAKRKLNLRR